MNNIVRAWKDEIYRQSLSAQEQAMLPANPAGEIELTDAELEAVYGAYELGRAETIINRVHQDVDQKAAATLGNGDIIINSLVRCSVKTDV